MVLVVKPLLSRAEVSVLRHWQEQLHHGRLSWIGVSLPWKTEYLEDCSTAMRRVARKVAAVEGGLVWFGSGFTAGTLFPDRWTCIWHVYTSQLMIIYSLYQLFASFNYICSLTYSDWINHLCFKISYIYFSTHISQIDNLYF